MCFILFLCISSMILNYLGSFIKKKTKFCILESLVEIKGQWSFSITLLKNEFNIPQFCLKFGKMISFVSFYENLKSVIFLEL